MDLSSGLHESLFVRTGGVIDDVAQGVSLGDHGVAHGQKHQEILYQSRRTLTLKKYSRHHTFFTIT
jgi:hypothetical protein